MVLPGELLNHNDDGIIPEIKNFDNFSTIDWIEEDKQSNRNEVNNNVYCESKWHNYKEYIWLRGKTFITLTIIAITIGGIAGFLQIVTETLVGWKSGYCSRNWMLNKSFCCINIVNEGSKVFEESELKCMENGIWVNWNNSVFSFMIFVVLSVIFGFLSAIMVKYISPMAAGSGISEIKVWISGFEYKKEFLGFVTLVVKSVGLPLAISSGLSIGKEGPSVHYSTCCGYVITNFLLGQTLTFSEQSEYLTASTAAGVAVAFGAPIGGVLFALEEIAPTSVFNLSTLWKSYYVALGAISTLQYINPFRNGKIVIFEVTYDKDWHVQEIPLFVLLGLFGGLYGNYISRWNIHFVSFRKKYLENWKIREVVVLSFITALLSYFNQFLKLDMTENMGVLFHECVKDDNDSIWTHKICQFNGNTNIIEFSQILFALIVATIIRALLVVVSYGCNVPAGIFVPSMAIGATFGRAVSLIVERFITGPHVITPGTYAFLGAGAALSGITNLTLTIVVIMFELTGAFMYIIPTMIVVAITRMVLMSLGNKGGIVDQMIIFNGFPLLENSKDDQAILNEYTANDIMSTDLITIKENISLANLHGLLQKVGNIFSGFPIIEDNGNIESKSRCIGYISTKNIEKYMLDLRDETTHGDIIVNFRNRFQNSTDDSVLNFGCAVDYTPITIKPTLSLSLLSRIFQKLGCKTVLVEDNGTLVGLITKKNLLKFQRKIHTDTFGPLYTFDERLDEKLWNLIQKCIDKIRIN